MHLSRNRFATQFVRHFFCAALYAAIGLLGACGGDDVRVAGSATGVAVSGESAQVLLPSNEPSKPFGSLNIAFASLGAVAGPGGNAFSTLSSPVILPGAAISCATSGCPYQVAGVSLAGTLDGVFALLAPSDATGAALYVPTATLVFNANQLIIANRSRGAQVAQGQAIAVSKDGLAQLGKLTGLSSSDLLGRGVCLGLVASSRGFSAGEVPAQAGALVTLRNAPAGAQLVYPDDSFQNPARQGTNARGAFIVVGGSAPAADGSGSTIAADIAASGSGLVYSNQRVVLRPNMVTIVPMLPTP